MADLLIFSYTALCPWNPEGLNWYSSFPLLAQSNTEIFGK